MMKAYSEMTPAEKVADRIAKNREIDRRVSESQSAASLQGSKRKIAEEAPPKSPRIKKERPIKSPSH